LLDVHMRLGLPVEAARARLYGACREIMTERDDKLLLRPPFLGQHCDGRAERSVGYVAAFGPVFPGVQRPDVHPVLAGDGRSGVRLADRLRVLAGRALVLDGHGVALHRRETSLLGACEVGLRSIDLLLGDVEFAAKAAALTAGSVVQLVSHCDLSSPCVGDASFGVVQCISIGSCFGRHVGGDAVGVGEGGVRLGLALCALRFTGLGVAEVAVGVVQRG